MAKNAHCYFIRNTKISMHTVTIRTAQELDLVKLNELMYSLHDEHHQQCREHFKTAEEIEQEKSIGRYLDDPQCIVQVAVVAERVVGFITGHFCELISTVSKPLQMGSIDELYVEPEFRKQQVAKKLCSAMEEHFDDYGVSQVFVEVWDFNQSALDFYAKHGFEPHIHWLRKAI